MPYKNIEDKREWEWEKKYNIIRKKNGWKYQKKWAKNNPEKVLVIMRRHFTKYGKTFKMNPNEYLYAINSWSKTIKKLDNNMCKLCDSKENINAHHLQPKQDFPQLCLDLNNGITLCKNCHWDVHGFEIY